MDSMTVKRSPQSPCIVELGRAATWLFGPLAPAPTSGSPLLALSRWGGPLRKSGAPGRVGAGGGLRSGWLWLDRPIVEPLPDLAEFSEDLVRPRPQGRSRAGLPRRLVLPRHVHAHADVRTRNPPTVTPLEAQSQLHLAAGVPFGDSPRERCASRGGVGHPRRNLAVGPLTAAQTVLQLAPLECDVVDLDAALGEPLFEVAEGNTYRAYQRTADRITSARNQPGETRRHRHRQLRTARALHRATLTATARSVNAT